LVVDSFAAPRRSVGRTLRTLFPIPPSQLLARAHFVARHRLYAISPHLPMQRARRATRGAAAVDPLPGLPVELLAPEGLDVMQGRAALLARGQFEFLGRAADFSAGIRWRDRDASPLWMFNLHYLGAVVDLTLSGRIDAAQRLLASWTQAFDGSWDAVAWHPYPASLRLTNLCLAAAHIGGFESLGEGTTALAATHAAYLLDHLEYDLRGNHLLENAVALIFASRCFRGHLASRCSHTARRVLAAEIEEQILPDGAHFELSPMYHVFVMHRLLMTAVLLGRTDTLVRDHLTPAVRRMARFLRGILCPDSDIPLLGDSARAFAPTPLALLALAQQWTEEESAPVTGGVTAFASSGLYTFRSPRLWAIFDAGPLCAPYLPGHGQADSLSVEVWCDGACVIADPGVHEYTGPQRAWGRSSRAHSTVTIDDADTSEVYGSFRVGGRARIIGIQHDAQRVRATLEPFGVQALVTREVRLDRRSGEQLMIVDIADAPAGASVRSRLHLHPAVTLPDGLAGDRRTAVVRTPRRSVRIRSQHPLRLEPARASRQFGMIESTTMIVQELRPRSEAASREVEGWFAIQPLD
jgi:uncharacterized heparinase superfamily protein